jgi:hypothetical protein
MYVPSSKNTQQKRTPLALRTEATDRPAGAVPRSCSAMYYTSASQVCSFPNRISAGPSATPGDGNQRAKDGLAKSRRMPPMDYEPPALSVLRQNDREIRGAIEHEDDAQRREDLRRRLKSNSAALSRAELRSVSENEGDAGPDLTFPRRVPPR